MDKLKQFLKDNKGCPLTVPAIKQLLVKFIELMSESSSESFQVSDIKAISKEVLDALKPGDIVEKITGKQKHTYIVTYKGEGAGEGICLTYCDAGYMETVSYDRSGSNWVYNSTDVVEVSPEAMAWVSQMKDYISVDDGVGLPSFSGIVVPHITEIYNKENEEPFFPSLTGQAGKVVKVKADELGFEYGEVSGGSLYYHKLTFTKSGQPSLTCGLLISSKSTPFESISDICDAFDVPQYDAVNVGFWYTGLKLIRLEIANYGSPSGSYKERSIDPGTQALSSETSTALDTYAIVDNVTPL